MEHETILEWSSWINISKMLANFPVELLYVLEKHYQTFQNECECE